MKIAVVIPKYGFLGGAEGFAFQLTERLAERDSFEIHVFANKRLPVKTQVRFHHVPIIPFPRFLKQLSFACFSRRQTSSHGFDLIHSHDRIFRMDLLTMHGIPHRSWIRKARDKRLSLYDWSVAWVEKRALTGPNPPFILAVSNLVKEELLQLYDISESRILVIHPGVSPEGFSKLDKVKCRQEISKRHGLSPADTIALFVGMNFEIKRLALVLEGIAELVRKEMRDSRLRLLVVGKGNREPYLAMARAWGIMERVVFAGITHEVEKYYLASDIFVMPSVFDTFGMTVLEAMAAGLPVIISERVGAKDIVASGFNGFVLGKAPSPLEFAEKLALLMEGGVRKAMGDHARSVALKNTWDRVADQMADVYHMVARG